MSEKPTAPATAPKFDWEDRSTWHLCSREMLHVLHVLILNNDTYCHPEVRSALAEIMNRLPEEAFRRIWVEQRTVVVSEHFEAYRAFALRLSPYPADAIILASRYKNRRRQIALLAHELAHVFLRHECLDPGDAFERQSQERDVELQVYQWGLESFRDISI